MYRNNTYNTYNRKGTYGHFANQEPHEMFQIPGSYSNAAFPLYEVAGQRARPKPRPAKQTQDDKGKTTDPKREEAKKSPARIEEVLEKIDEVLESSQIALQYKQTAGQ